MNLADEIRRLKQRLDNQISLREFGAVMDGATDDLPQVQAMITTLGSLAVTLIVSGPCYVSGNVTIPANLLIRFEGGGSFVGPGVVAYAPWPPDVKQLPVYADNAAATAGGLLAGAMYRTAIGQLMVRY